MERFIRGYSTDDSTIGANDWVAWLDCGHPQHVRHRPPFTNRPWVTTTAGRDEHLGTPLNCVRCDALELPAGLSVTRTTRQFTDTSLPAALQADHTTRAGVWGRIVIESGAATYHVDSLDHHATLDAEHPGIIPPQVPHRLQPHAPMACHIEFLHVPADYPSTEQRTVQPT